MSSQATNITDRHEKLYTMLLEAIPSSVLLINRELRITSTNNNFLEKSRRTMANTIGQRIEDVFPTVILDHIDLTRRIRQVIEMNEPSKGARMTYRAPGVPMRIYYYTILPFFWEGKIEGVMILMDDVTEQERIIEDVRRIERHLASVVESASDIVLSTDVEGRISTWNMAAEILSGYNASQVKDRYFSEFCSEINRKEIKTIFSQFKNNRIKISQMKEFILMTQQGRQIAISWVFSPMRDHLDQVTGVVAVGRDLTERREFEEQLLQSQKLAALGIMAGGIAHEIRNPLSICSSASQFLMEDKVTDDFRKENADKIYKGVRRASVIIENLLKFAHPSLRTPPVQINLISLIKETITLVAYQSKVKKVEIITNFPDDSVNVKGTTDLLQQVFMNLFLNAINSMPDGGILEVSVNIKDKEVYIYIKDNGIGIPKIAIGKVFDPFYTTSPVGKGTGLGLSLCYSIVKQHDGTIDVESILGKGSTFIVRLPK